MEQVEFLVQGSAAEPYRVTFLREQRNVSAFCTCPAGTNGLVCKHRLAILGRDGKCVVSNNTADVEIVASWLAGSDIEQALADLASAEGNLELAKKSVAQAKQRLARVMKS